MRDWTETDNLRMIIDARKIISNLDIPLENVELETLQNVKWGLLINETYNDIIESVGYFTNSAMRILKSKTPENMWERCRFKRGIWDYYYVSYSEE